MSTASTAPIAIQHVSPAYGFMPGMRRLPPLPSTQEVVVARLGHPLCRAVAAYDISGAVQHFVLLLDAAGSSTAISQQTDIFGGFWERSPLGCDMCRSLFRSAVSVLDQCAFTFFEACTHGTSPNNRPADDTSDSDSDSSGHYGLESDQQQDDVENLAASRLTEEFGYTPICGNLIIVKHSLVESLPAQIMDADLYNVLAEDFSLISGLIRSRIALKSTDMFWATTIVPIYSPPPTYLFTSPSSSGLPCSRSTCGGQLRGGGLAPGSKPVEKKVATSGSSAKSRTVGRWMSMRRANQFADHMLVVNELGFLDAEQMAHAKHDGSGLQRVSRLGRLDPLDVPGVFVGLAPTTPEYPAYQTTVPMWDQLKRMDEGFEVLLYRPIAMSLEDKILLLSAVYWELDRTLTFSRGRFTIPTTRPMRLARKGSVLSTFWTYCKAPAGSEGSTGKECLLIVTRSAAGAVKKSVSNIGARAGGGKSQVGLIASCTR
ncbi:hypothetical protein C8F01DRAFT_1085174 [Mycena amicta]|nr:hypothetical protein C8F01DRAFT_1085174 [Mycena amicta]